MSGAVTQLDTAARERTKACVALTAHTLVSAGTYLVAKEGLRELGAARMAWLRFVLAAIVFAILLAAMRRTLLPPAGHRARVLALAVVGLPLNQGLFLAGLARSSPLHAAILYALTPAAVLIGSRLVLGEVISAKRWLAIAVAFAGVALVLAEHLSFDRAMLIGDVLLLLGVLAWAAFTVGARPIVRQHGALATSGWAQILGALLCAPLGPVVMRPLDDLATMSAWAWIGLAWLVFGTSLAAYLLWTYGLKRLEAAKVAVFTNLQPVATAFLSWLFLREAVTWIEAAGGLLVVAGITLLQRA